MASSWHDHWRKRREEARDLHVEQVRRRRHARAGAFGGGRHGDHDLLTSLAAERAEVRALAVEEGGVDRRARREKRLRERQYVLAAQRRRRLLQGALGSAHQRILSSGRRCGVVVTKGKLERERRSISGRG